jgi:uncharacterized protein
MSFAVSFDLTIFLLGTFIASFVTGLAGFAFGMVAAGIWLFALTPLQTTTLIVAYALLVQGYSTWRLRRAINPSRLWPFVIGSAIGIPAGIAILELASAVHLKIGVGVLLIAFSLYNLLRPKMPDLKNVGPAGDASVGFLNGVLGGATGLGGVLPTLWCVLRNWPRDEHRAVSQPTAVATFALTLMAFGGLGLVTPDTTRLFLIGLPVLIAGTLLGWSLYGKLDEVAFRKVVLVLLLVSGLAIVITGR